MSRPPPIKGPPPAWRSVSPIDYLTLFGRVVDMKTRMLIPFDPFNVTVRLQAAVLNYYAAPPRTIDGQVEGLNLLGSRQSTKSATAEWCAFVDAANIPGFSHKCLADTKDRANELHRRVHDLYHELPDIPGVKPKRKSTTETRQFTFLHENGADSIMAVMGANDQNVGIGITPHSLHISEGAFMDDLEILALILPSVLNQDEAIIIKETTPAPRKFSQAGKYRRQYEEDKRNPSSRFRSVFFPMWDSRLNRKTWDPSWTLEDEEIKWLDKYGVPNPDQFKTPDYDGRLAYGLTYSNLAHLRVLRATEGTFRANPDWVSCFYPFDDVSCWGAGGSGIFRPHHLLYPEETADVPWDWKEDTYQVYQEPRADAIYLLCADPPGDAARNHGSYHIFEVWADRIIQVAFFSDTCLPEVMAAHALEQAIHYNNAYIAAERSGVGQGFIGPIRSAGYRHLLSEKKNGPAGFWPSLPSLSLWKEALKEHLASRRMVIRSLEMLVQLQSYGGEKELEESVRAEMSRGEPSQRVRGKLHWDGVSAALIGAAAIPLLPSRLFPTPQEEEPEPSGPTIGGILAEMRQQAQTRQDSGLFPVYSSSRAPRNGGANPSRIRYPWED